MIGMLSTSAGALILPEPKNNDNIFLNLIDGKKIDPIKALYLYSAAQDWREIEGLNTKTLLENASEEYWIVRSVSLVRMLLSGLEKSLANRVFQEVEDILDAHLFEIEKILSRLLIAPLNETHALNSSVKQALSNGFSGTASLLDELSELQPLLCRFTDIWLGLPESAFNNFNEPKEVIWVKVAEKCNIKKLLTATQRSEFINQWNLLTFHFTSPQFRSGINLLAQELSKKIFPHESKDHQITEIISGSDKSESIVAGGQGINDYESFIMVKKQISAITEALSKGQDSKAEKFVRELVQQQTTSFGNRNYLVKSLCNIAQQCAEMFRLDFEVECLNKALSLLPHDTWALIQYGDHLKRVGKYDLALQTLAKAKLYGGNKILKASEADVYCQRGDYSKAISTYKSIQDWKNIPAVLTAIADNQRKMGSLDLAETGYKDLIRREQQGLFDSVHCNTRAYTGVAEIAKRRGDFKRAISIYNETMSLDGLDNRDLLYCKLGLSNVLKITGDFNGAYKIADEIIQQYPFALEARFLRGSILGLIGREQEGLLDLPVEEGTKPSWRKWLRHYYRGLLLLKLDRYDEAKKDLVDEFPNAIASGEEKTILRMAAALWYLMKDDISSANEKLSKLSDLHDNHSQYLSLVLKLHCATLQEDAAKITSIRKDILGFNIIDVELNNAVLALEKKEYTIALQCETDAFLKLAA